MRSFLILLIGELIFSHYLLIYCQQIYNPDGRLYITRDQNTNNNDLEQARGVASERLYGTIPIYNRFNAYHSYPVKETNTVDGRRGMRNVVQLGLPQRNQLSHQQGVAQNMDYGGMNSQGSLYWNATNNRSLYLIPHARPVVTHMSPNNENHGENYIRQPGTVDDTICNHPDGFLRKQRHLCQRYLHLMESVIKGYFMGLHECQYQFSSDRWNCGGHNVTVPNMNKQKLRLRFRKSQDHLESQNNNRKKEKRRTYMDKLLSKGTRESAYVLAVTSAGVSHAVTKACSSGRHENCGCDRTVYDHPREPNFAWSGCSDNIHFGAAFSRKFLDIRERKRVRRRPKLGLTNLHNNHVGRQAVISAMQVQCKCHGVSGSCEMRTCWRSLPSFRSLGEKLRERFHSAILVDYINQKLTPLQAQASGVRRKYRSSTTDHGKNLLEEKPTAVTENDLLYISTSPTYCDHDPGFGSIGTHGRECEENTDGPNRCNHLCCDRGFQRATIVQDERCNCKFQWCCKVVCQTCRKTVTLSRCN